MFVPVSCTSCGKPFQVPEAALGKLAPCPWCQTVVTALPVSAPVAESAPQGAPPAASPQQTPPQQTAQPKAEEPLSLDDSPGRPVAQPVKPAAPLSVDLPAEPQVGPPTRAASKVTVLTVFLAISLVMVVTATTLLALGYRSGRISDVGWSEFTPPDGSFTILLPGSPKEEDIAPNPAGSHAGGKRYFVRGWYSKTTVWVGYCDLDPGLVTKLPQDKDRTITAGVLRAERDRELTRLSATVVKEAEVRLNAAWGVELHLDTPNGRVIEWLILSGEGAHPRLYTYGAEGKNLTPTTPACAKLFKSFRINE